MKKLFISCPIRDRSDEAIAESRKRLKMIAEAAFNEELEVIDSIVNERPPVNSKESIWHLGNSIKKLAEADYFIGINYARHFIECDTERNIAQSYGIPTFCVPLYIFPDAFELEEHKYDEEKVSNF